MKTFYAFACTAMLLSCAPRIMAQVVTPTVNQHIPDKPLLFASLPAKFECNLEEVDRLFMSEPSQKLVLKLNTHLELDGTVTEKVRRSPEVLTINFRSNNYPGALFTISRIIQDGMIKYNGRIVNKDNGDVLMLVKENEKYHFTKMAQRFVMTE